MKHYFLSYDPVSKAHYVVPELYRVHWERWLVRDPESTSEETTVYARRLGRLEDLRFKDPQFRQYGDARMEAEWL